MRRDEMTTAGVSRRGRGRRGGRVIAAVMASLLLSLATPVVADTHDPEDTAHPLRIVAYALYPIGVAIDYLILRPAHWLVEFEPFKTVFGHED